MTVEAEPRYAYEPRRTRFNEAAISLIICTTAGVITALALGGTWTFLFLALTAIASGIFVRRAFRLALIASNHGVEVRNYWRTYAFDWLEVREVGLGEEAMGVLPQPAIVFSLRNGRLVRAQATPVDVSDQIASLNRLADLAPPTVGFPVVAQTSAR